jgi:hypothetical protein
MVLQGDDNTTMNTMPNLKYVIENEFFIICPFLPTDYFIQYCKDRGIQTSRKQLEQFEKLGIFYPIARIRSPKIKTKIEYIDNGKRYRDLGISNDGEEWAGEIKEKYAVFYFQKEYAMGWLEEGHLWNPVSQPFQAWKTFNDEKGYRQTESFYSIFQCYTLYDLIRLTKIELRAEAWVSHSKEDINVTSKVLDWAEMVIYSHQKNGIKGEAAVATCQIISNRYFPITQSDRRSIQVSAPIHYGNEYWDEYCRDWNAKAVLDDLGMTIDELKQLHEQVAHDAKNVDPLERWYELISFVSVGEKKKLKGKALFAQTLYSMEQMLRLFYEDLTGNKLLSPDESPIWKKDKFYGEGVTKNELQYLEFLTNKYHLNPRPQLILVVEGDGEAEQFPRLAKELFGYSFPQLGIEVVNIQGVGNFTGKKNTDRYGALERFIDDYHYRQTIVFVVLDNEGRVPVIKNRLIRARSKCYPKRKVTKNEYIQVWDKNIEFDNFSPDEIALAMTELSEGRYIFKADDIADCEKYFNAKKGNHLEEFFKKKVNYDLLKVELLKILFGFILSHPENEFDADDKAKRPVVRVIEKVTDLARKNYYRPVTRDIWQKNQESGFFGDLIE